MRAPPWSAAQIKFLRQHYGVFPMGFLTERLGRSAGAIRIMAHKLRREDQRVEAAQKLRNVSRVTKAAA